MEPNACPYIDGCPSQRTDHLDDSTRARLQPVRACCGIHEQDALILLGNEEIAVPERHGIGVFQMDDSALLDDRVIGLLVKEACRLAKLVEFPIDNTCRGSTWYAGLH